MAAPDMNVSRLGQLNGAGDDKALFLKVFAGEVIAAFEETNVMRDRQLVRTISSGKSAQFPATWKIDANYHTPGTYITGNKVKHNERVINIDDLLIAPVFIANIDEAMNHYDVRSIYSTEAGRALSYIWDKNSLQVSILAARASATVSGGFGGSSFTDAALATNAAKLIAFASFAAQTFDEKDVPEAERSLILRPAQYYLMVNSKDAVNKDWGGSAASGGGYANGKMPTLFGLDIVKSNHIPNTNIATGPATYQGDFTNTVAVASQKGAIGTVKLLDMKVESEYEVTLQGTIIVAKYAMGQGILRPECAIEGKTA